MIANFTSGRDFAGLARYLKGYGKVDTSEKKAVVLGAAGVRTDTLAHLIADFERGQKLHPELGKAVLHISLSFNPDDAARMTDQKMRQVADDYLDKMDLKGTQYLLVRHHDRPHHHLHIMANRVATDGHTIGDSNNFFASEKALDFVMDKHKLSPAKGHRPHLQHPERLRGGDLAKYEMREAIRRALATETQRVALLATLREQGIKSREFVDENGNVVGISFQKDKYSCKGSALGREFSLTAIDKQLAANQQKVPEAVSSRDEVVTLLEASKAERIGEKAPLPLGDTVQASQAKVSVGTEVPIVPQAIEASVSPNTQEPERLVPAQQVEVLSPVPASAAPITEGPMPALVAVPATLSQPVAAEAALPGTQTPASPDTNAASQQVVAASASDPLSATPASASPTVAPGAEAIVTPVSSEMSWQREQELLAKWEAQQLADAEQDRLDAAYQAWLELGAQVRPQVATATYEALTTGNDFATLLNRQGLTLVPATADEPAQVQHQASGQFFPPEEVPLPLLLLTPASQATAQYGLIQMGDSDTRPASERLALVREHLLEVGLTVGPAEPARPGQPAQLAYAFSPQQADLALVESKLNAVQASTKTRVFEAPHALQSPAKRTYGHAVPCTQWSQREGQFNQARVEIDNADQRAPDRAKRLRQDLQQQGVLLGPVQTTDQGRLTFELRYHTLSPAIEAIDSTLYRAKDSAGIHLQESQQQERARFNGIMTLAERQKSLGYERD